MQRHKEEENQIALNASSKIVIIGIGGAGGNAVNNLISNSLEADFIAANTDVKALEAAMTERRIQLGASHTRDLGANGNPIVGREAAKESLDVLVKCMKHYDNIIFIAGLGGGTGSGALPIFAKAAMAKGKKIFCIVTTPFAFEGTQRDEIAGEAIKKLMDQKIPFFALANQDLFRFASEKTTFADAFRMIDTAVCNIVRDYVHGGFDAAAINSQLPELYRDRDAA